MEGYIEQLKTAYLSWRGGTYARQGYEYCLGSKAACEPFIEDGAHQLPWGVEPSPEQYGSVKSLRLFPNAQQIKTASVPLFVKKCAKLEFIAMPVSFIMQLTPDALPDSIRSMMLRNSKETAALVKNKNLIWPDSAVARNIRAIQFPELGGAVEVDSLFGISEQVLPSLEFLECSVRKGKRRLETIFGFRKLKFLALEHVAGQNVFESVNSPLQALSIVDAGRDLPFNDISRLKSVEMLWLNNLRCTVDCSVLARLPMLKELEVLNSNKISNIRALLNIGTLESIRFLSCGKPFTAEDAALFHAKNYRRLEIDFA